MHAQDFNITLVRNALVISGVRHRPNVDTLAYHRVEIGYGEFHLEIPMPWTIQSDAVNAAYHEGFLKIDLPRSQKRQIPIVEKQMSITTTEEEDEAPNE